MSLGFWLGFGAGMVAGTSLGVLLMCILYLAAWSDREDDE